MDPSLEDAVEGRLFAERYRLVRVIATGGIGVLLEGLDERTGQRVAVKLLRRTEDRSRPQMTERLLREARAAATLGSEHAVRIVEADLLPDGEPYLVMEYLVGRDLSQLLEAQGPLGVAEAAEYVIQAADAVAEAHALGIVHRDLKPANLFLTEGPDGAPLVKVLDFGISKVPSDVSLTASGTGLGSPLYMAPEQIMNAKRVDARADAWGLGVVLYELLSGQTPFTGAGAVEVYRKIAREPHPPLSSLVPGLPPLIEAIVARCLEKDPERRFTSAAELAVTLAAFAPQRVAVTLAKVTERPPPVALTPASPGKSEARSPPDPGGGGRADSAAAKPAPSLEAPGGGALRDTIVDPPRPAPKGRRWVVPVVVAAGLGLAALALLLLR